MEGVKFELKDAADWAYRGEGAANIVLAYTGSSPDFMGKVMRIRKVGRKESPNKGGGNSVLTEEERLVWKEAEEMVTASTKEMVDQLYVSLVIRPLLGPSHVDPGVRVLVSREFLEAVEERILPQRPAWRVQDGMIDTCHHFSILMSDHSVFPHGVLGGGPCLSVEIKPKCGFLPSSRFIADEHAFKRSITRFRMHQLLKLQQHEISELSQYDPLDLFSGSRERIHKAIKGLYATPQNNFRVFLNGSLIFGGLGGGTKKTTTAIGDAFEEKLRSIIFTDNGLRTESFLELVAEMVYSSGILDRLLEVQNLDKFDIEGAIHAYYNIVSQPCMVCRRLNEARLPNGYSFLHSLPIDESLKIVKDYLIAATAKDCSVILTFKPTVDGELKSSYCSTRLPSTNQSFEYKVNFIDLDLKSLKKMEDYYVLDKKILTCYAQTVKMENAICDSACEEICEAKNLG